MGFDKLSMSGCCLLLAQPKRPAQPEPVEGRANSVELATIPRAPSIHPPVSVTTCGRLVDPGVPNGTPASANDKRRAGRDGVGGPCVGLGYLGLGYLVYLVNWHRNPSVRMA